MDDHTRLIQAALEARAHSYSPYSHFQVGAALLTRGGKIYTGCNVESASYSPTCCAERVALFSAVAAGERAFAAIAIAGGPAGEEPSQATPPCGVCRQALAEFCDPRQFQVVLPRGGGEPPLVYRLEELLPLAFTPQSLGRPRPPQRR